MSRRLTSPFPRHALQACGFRTGGQAIPAVGRLIQQRRRWWVAAVRQRPSGSRRQRCPARRRTPTGAGRGQNADVALRLLRINGTRQVVGFGAFTKLFQCGGLNVCVADIHNEPEAFPEVVGALHNNVQSLDASGGYISLGGDLSFTAFKIESDQNLKLVVQKHLPSCWPLRCGLAATLRPRTTLTRM